SWWILAILPMVVLRPRRGIPPPSCVNFCESILCEADTQEPIACYCSRVATERNAVLGEATVTASGIARMANVGRAAVSNWRPRFAAFPAPVVGTPTSSVFGAREVERRLRPQGKLHKAGTEPWAWRHTESCQPAAQMAVALGIAGAYLLSRAGQ